MSHSTVTTHHLFQSLSTKKGSHASHFLRFLTIPAPPRIQRICCLDRKAVVIVLIVWMAWLDDSTLRPHLFPVFLLAWYVESGWQTLCTVEFVADVPECIEICSDPPFPLPNGELPGVNYVFSLLYWHNEYTHSYYREAVVTRQATVIVFHVISGMIQNVLPVSRSIFGDRQMRGVEKSIVANTVCIPKVTIEKLMWRLITDKQPSNIVHCLCLTKARSQGYVWNSLYILSSPGEQLTGTIPYLLNVLQSQIVHTLFMSNCSHCCTMARPLTGVFLRNCIVLICYTQQLYIGIY